MWLLFWEFDSVTHRFVLENKREREASSHIKLIVYLQCDRRALDPEELRESCACNLFILPTLLYYSKQKPVCFQMTASLVAVGFSRTIFLALYFRAAFTLLYFCKFLLSNLLKLLVVIVVVMCARLLVVP